MRGERGERVSVGRGDVSWGRREELLLARAADGADLGVECLGAELESLSSERLDHAPAQAEDLERAAVRHLELALDRGADLVLVYGPEEGERLGRGGEAQGDVLAVELVEVNLDGDHVRRAVVDAGDREDYRAAGRYAV